MDAKILEQLFDIIQARAAAPASPAQGSADSYTAALLKEGKGKIARKVGEEAVELIVAALDEGEERFVNESADLLYHWLVLCQAMDIAPEKVYQTLSERMNAKKNK